MAFWRIIPTDLKYSRADFTKEVKPAAAPEEKRGTSDITRLIWIKMASGRRRHDSFEDIFK